MAYLTRDGLRARAARQTMAQINEVHQRLGAKSATVRATVFLSHSRGDADIIEPTLQALADEGVLVYVDWKDPTLPAITSPATASALKERIKLCRKFLLLATNNAVGSRWVPWELGIADSQNGMMNVAIIPVQDSRTTWQGSEYIGIYARVESASSGQLAVFEPGKQQGIYFADWLAR